MRGQRLPVVESIDLCSGNEGPRRLLQYLEQACLGTSGQVKKTGKLD